jgi:hypothetical protein
MRRGMSRIKEGRRLSLYTDNYVWGLRAVGGPHCRRSVDLFSGSQGAPPSFRSHAAGGLRLLGGMMASEQRSRRQFLAWFTGVSLAVIAGGRPAWASPRPTRSEHPEPRPGIDASKVLTDEHRTLPT